MSGVIESGAIADLGNRKVIVFGIQQLSPAALQSAKPQIMTESFASVLEQLLHISRRNALRLRDRRTAQIVFAEAKIYLLAQPVKDTHLGAGRAFKSGPTRRLASHAGREKLDDGYFKRPHVLG